MKVLALQATPQLAARPAARPGRRAVRVCAQQPTPSPTQSVDVVDDNIGEYCTLDSQGKRPTRELTTAEKEQLFLEAMMSYYMENNSSPLSDEEFDNLKQELQWEGSKVVMMSKEEQRFLEARLAFGKGQPIMSDAEYDTLKASLAGSGVFSLVTPEGPVCSLDRPDVRGRREGAASTDWAKMVGVQLPAALVVGGIIAGLDLATGGAVAELPGKVGVVFWGGLVLPFAYVTWNAIARFMFNEALILKAPCPNCGEVNTTYFGDILTVEGSRDQNMVKCRCCDSQLTFDAKQKQVVVTQVGNAA